MSSVVYWIRLPEHTDMFTQGYVGITNNLNNRLEAHKNRPSNNHLANAIEKYGWDNLVKQVIVIAHDTYCLMVESALRNANNIGWNIVEGGGKPPVSKKGCNLGKAPWNKGVAMSDETKQKLSASNKGKVAWNNGLKTPDEVKVKQSLAKLGKPGVRKGMVHSEESKLKISLANYGKLRAEETRLKMSKSRIGIKFKQIECPHCHKIGGASAMPRWHFDNCKEYK